MKGRDVGTRLLLLSVSAILVLTLFPAGGDAPKGASICIICGDRGLADAVSNMILFAPFGVALALLHRRPMSVAIAALLLSLSVESLQSVIPGRYTSLGDVAFNTLGATIAAYGWLNHRSWITPRRVVASRFYLAASIAAATVFLLTAYFLHPAFPMTTYYGQWTPQVAHLEWYNGRVTQVSLSDMTLPSRRLEQSAEVRLHLIRGSPMVVRFVGGTPVTGLASLFSIADERRRGVMLLGPDRGDLVFRYRMRADNWRLDRPDHRFQEAFGNIAPGDTGRAAVWRDGDAYCLEVNSHRRCGLGYTIGDGWALLVYPERLPSILQELIGLIWVAILLVPLGFWARRGALAVIGALPPLVVLLAVNHLSSLLATTPAEWIAATAGVAVGVVLRRLVDRWTSDRSPPPLETPA